MSNEAKIMLVEDNELDVRMILLKAKKNQLYNSIEVFHDGSSALDSLHDRKDEELPNLILLDISLPGVNGLELLKSIKADDRLRRIVVVMLTSSASTMDIAEAYSSYAAGFITKPVDSAGFTDVVNGIANYYFGIVTLPSHDL